MNNRLPIIILIIILCGCNKTKQIDKQEKCLFNDENLIYYFDKPIFDSVCATLHKNLINANISTITVYLNEYKYVIESWYVTDSVSIEEKNLFYPTVIKQNIKIYKDNQFFDTLYLPLKQITQRLFDGRKLKMTENVLLSFGIVGEKQAKSLILEGFGGCNSCSEYQGIYTLDGKIISIYYGSKDSIYIDKLNDSLAHTIGLNIDNIDAKYSKIKLW